MNLLAMKLKMLKLSKSWIITALIILGSSCKTQQSSTNADQEKQSAPASVVSDSSSYQTKVEEILDAESQEELEPEEKKFSIKDFAVQRDITNYLKKSKVFSSHFTGFCLWDVDKHQIVAEYNSDKFFTPASNVKILTLYAVLKSFGQQLPGALYRETTDTLFIRPIGDPTFLNQYFDDQPLLNLILRTNKPVSIEWPSEDLDSFGIGWMWDDYNSRYMPELSWFPIYGNIVKFEYERYKIKAQPALFNDLVEINRNYERRSNTVRRAQNFNYFSAEIRYPNWSFEKEVPFKYSKPLALQLLAETTKGTVTSSAPKEFKMDTLYSQPMDTVLRRMMQDSDNFLSEQLLIMAAWKNGFTDQEAFREFITDNWLTEMEPVWIDGSGLSRYNLSRPFDNVLLLRKIYEEFGWSKIYDYFPKGGESGTLKDWYANATDPLNPEMPPRPYVIAKTGTLSNVHNVSGYLITKSGKLMIFSVMNNNFVRPTEEVKQGIQELLEGIRDAY